MQKEITCPTLRQRSRHKHCSYIQRLHSWPYKKILSFQQILRCYAGFNHSLPLRTSEPGMIREFPGTQAHSDNFSMDFMYPCFIHDTTYIMSRSGKPRFFATLTNSLSAPQKTFSVRDISHYCSQDTSISSADCRRSRCLNGLLRYLLTP